MNRRVARRLFVGGVALLVALGHSVAAQAGPWMSMAPALLAGVQAARAQPAARGQQIAQEPAWVAEGRACEACPRRRPWLALIEAALFVNGLSEAGNLIRGQETAKITPKTWWTNMKQGWVWDLDDFAVNQIGHPYQGNMYFNSGRANGLGFYESAAVAAFGSATWEYFGETNYASINDFINTTLGGTALGEMFHRAGWLVRDTQATGRGRLWREIGGAAIDPMTGLNRFLSGDHSRVSPMPPDLVPSGLNGVFSVGALWQEGDAAATNSGADPFLEVDLLYGDTKSGRSRTPYDAFTVRLRFGGGGGFTEARVRGRLLGEPFGGRRGQLMVVQAYDYNSNAAFNYGAQSFNATVGWTSDLGDDTSLWFGGWGGATILGAVDSLPLDDGAEPLPEDPADGPGQGIAVGPRDYDYGPGGNFGAFASLFHNNLTLVSFGYTGWHIYSLDGVRANYFLQRARLDLVMPVHRRLGVGVAGEYFSRQTFYKDADQTVTSFSYPQFRVYLTWNVS